MDMFQNRQPEELLGLLKNLKKAIDRTRTTTVAGQMNFLRTILRGGSLKEFKDLASHNSGTMNANLKEL